MLLISEDTDLEAVARNVAQPAKQQQSFSVADLVLIPLDPDKTNFGSRIAPKFSESIE
jgi:hypothetical protein